LCLAEQGALAFTVAPVARIWRVKQGADRVRLGARRRHFQARPGRYEAVLRATDPSANESKPVKLRFSIDR